MADDALVIAEITVACSILAAVLITGATFLYYRHTTPFKVRVQSVIFTALALEFTFGVLKIIKGVEDYYHVDLGRCSFRMFLVCGLLLCIPLAWVLQSLRVLYLFLINEWATNILSERVVPSWFSTVVALRSYAKSHFLAKCMFLSTTIVISGFAVCSIWVRPSKRSCSFWLLDPSHVSAVQVALMMVFTMVVIIVSILLARLRRYDFGITVEFWLSSATFLVFIFLPYLCTLPYKHTLPAGNQRGAVMSLLCAITIFFWVLITGLTPFFYLKRNWFAAVSERIEDFAVFVGTNEGFYSVLSGLRHTSKVEHVFFLRDYKQWRLLWKPTWYKEANMPSQRMAFDSDSWVSMAEEKREEILTEAMRILNKYGPRSASVDSLLPIEFPLWLQQKCIFVLHYTGLLDLSPQGQWTPISSIEHVAQGMESTDAELVLDVMEDIYLDVLTVAHLHYRQRQRAQYLQTTLQGLEAQIRSARQKLWDQAKKKPLQAMLERVDSRAFDVVRDVTLHVHETPRESYRHHHGLSESHTGLTDGSLHDTKTAWTWMMPNNEFDPPPLSLPPSLETVSLPRPKQNQNVNVTFVYKVRPARPAPPPTPATGDHEMYEAGPARTYQRRAKTEASTVLQQSPLSFPNRNIEVTPRTFPNKLTIEVQLLREPSTVILVDHDHDQTEQPQNPVNFTAPATASEDGPLRRPEPSPRGSNTASTWLPENPVNFTALAANEDGPLRRRPEPSPPSTVSTSLPMPEPSPRGSKTASTWLPGSRSDLPQAMESKPSLTDLMVRRHGTPSGAESDIQEEGSFRFSYASDIDITYETSPTR